MSDIIGTRLRIVAPLLVDAPTESGVWCPVDEENGIGAAVEVVFSEWIDVDDNGHDVQRVTRSVYHHGSEERSDLDGYRPDVRWLSVTDLINALVKETDRHAEAQAELVGLREGYAKQRLALERAHHTIREYAPRCTHPACDELAPLLCEDCNQRYCEKHDDGCEGHDDAYPLPHAVGPDDLMAQAAMREAGGAR